MHNIFTMCMYVLNDDIYVCTYVYKWEYWRNTFMWYPEWRSTFFEGAHTRTINWWSRRRGGILRVGVWGWVAFEGVGKSRLSVVRFLKYHISPWGFVTLCCEHFSHVKFDIRTRVGSDSLYGRLHPNRNNCRRRVNTEAGYLPFEINPSMIEHSWFRDVGNYSRVCTSGTRRGMISAYSCTYMYLVWNSL